jgi:hypothetical protein
VKISKDKYSNKRSTRTAVEKKRTRKKSAQMNKLQIFKMFLFFISEIFCLLDFCEAFSEEMKRFAEIFTSRKKKK